VRVFILLFSICDKFRGASPEIVPELSPCFILSSVLATSFLPEVVWDRGRPSHVLFSVESYQKLAAKQKSIVELLGMPQAAEVEFEPPRLKGNLHKPADLS